MDKAQRRIYKQRKNQRAYEAAKAGRLNSKWSLSAANINADIGQGLDALRAHSRDLSQNDAIATRYLQLMEDNIIGKEGIQISPMARLKNGKLDTNINKVVSTAWKKWGKTATVYKKSWLSLQKEIIRNVARDGECLVQIMRGSQYGAFGMRLKLLDPAHLDVSYNTVLRDGNDIRQSIEIDNDGVPVAYWLFNVLPDDQHSQKSRKRIRVPAEDLLHIFKKEYAGQLRGVPFTTPVMRDMKNCSDYAFVELVAARVAASSGLIITEAEGAEDDEDEDDDGITFRELEPGSVEVIPHGATAQVVDPTHPNGNYAGYTAAVIQRISAGLQVSYGSLSGDLSKANYASMRAGALIERDSYRSLQTWLIEELHDRIYNEWVGMALLTLMLKVPLSKLDQVEEVKWKPRGWAWVDPAKDIQAVETSLLNSLKSRSSVSSDNGEDYETILAEIASDKELEAKYKVEPKTTKELGGAPAKPEEKKDEDEEKKVEDKEEE